MRRRMWWRYFTDEEDDDDDDDEYPMLLKKKARIQQLFATGCHTFQSTAAVCPAEPEIFGIQIVMLFSFFTFLE